MYEQFFGLRERPFSLTSNPRYLLLTSRHAEALSALQYGISRRLGIIVLVGEAGTGKTTVIRAAVAAQGPAGRFVITSNPLLSTLEFFQHLTAGFGLSDAALTSKTRFLSELTATLEDGLRHDRPSALVVDEAHALPHEILEEIRLLANIETDEEKLLPVVLAGQPELGERLNEPSLRQLKQRVALRCVLGSLHRPETGAYIAGRIRVAGGDAAQVFTPEAVELIHRRSHGLPRTISVICDNAMVTAFAADERPIGRETVMEVCRDLDLPALETDEEPRGMIVLPPPGPARPSADGAPAPLAPPQPTAPRGSGARLRFFRPFFLRSRATGRIGMDA